MIYSLNNVETLKNPPIFLENILGELIHEEDLDDQDGNSKGNENELKRKKKYNKKSKKNVSFKSQQKSSSGVPKGDTTKKPKKRLIKNKKPKKVKTTE